MIPLLSEEKHMHLSHVILQALQRSAEARLTGEPAVVLKEIKQVLTDQLSLEQEIDRKVRARLTSYSRPIPEGSSEWDVLYQKTYQEELRKRQMD